MDLTDDSPIGAFLRTALVEEHPVGHTIVHAGDRADTVFYIVSGAVEVTILGERGNDLLLDRLGKGEFFGEMGFFVNSEEHGLLRRADVRSRTDSRIASLSYGAFDALATRHPALLYELACQLATRLHRANRWRLDLDRR
jgi:CRP/FNR family cyclic AMP-dependent transcriptional regulator